MARVTSRPLHALLLPPRQVYQHLSAALNEGPAILPLDPNMSASRLDQALDALRPAQVFTVDGSSHSPYPAEPVADDIAVVICTSGSTGAPKGVRLSTPALHHSARSTLNWLAAGPRDRWLCCLPTHHIAGIQILVRSIVGGTEPVIHDTFTLDGVAASGLRGEATFVSLVPTMLHRLLDAGADLSAFSRILLGGAAAPDSVLSAARHSGARITTTYGMSETSGGCIYDGHPLDGVTVHIGDHTTDPTTEPGRIVLGGPMLASGYRGDADGNHAAFAGGLFHTSDLGQLSADGQLTVLGRLDDVINTGAEKVMASQVTAHLLTHPEVREAAVFGRPDSEWGERVVAAVVPATAASGRITLDQLRAHVRTHLGAAAAPRELIVLPELPTLSSGKLDRVALRQLPPGLLFDR